MNNSKSAREQEPSPHIAPVSRMMARARYDWTPGWTDSHSYSYGLKEAQVQSYLDKPWPG